MIECPHQHQVTLLLRIQSLVQSQIQDILYCLGQEAARENDRFLRQILFWRNPLTWEDIIQHPRTGHQRHLAQVYQQLISRKGTVSKALDCMRQAPSGALSDSLCCLYAKALEPIPYDCR